MARCCDWLVVGLRNVAGEAATMRRRMRVNDDHSRRDGYKKATFLRKTVQYDETLRCLEQASGVHNSERNEGI